MFYIVFTSYLVSALGVVLKTTMSSHYSLTLVEDYHIHPWVYDTDVFEGVSLNMDQAFVDWSNVMVR
jgi:hypothetical protein